MENKFIIKLNNNQIIKFERENLNVGSVLNMDQEPIEIEFSNIGHVYYVSFVHNNIAVSYFCNTYKIEDK